MAFTACGCFTRARPQPPHSQNSLVVGSSDAHDVLAHALLSSRPRIQLEFLNCTVPSGEQDVLVSKLVIDVTDFSRTGVAALRYSHSSSTPKNDRLRNSFVEHSDNKPTYKIASNNNFCRLCKK